MNNTAETEAPRSEKAQRVRVRFARGPEALSIGQLDLARAWERAFRDAGLPVSQSQGNKPQARITLGAGLAANVTSDGELLDVVLAEHVRPDALIESVAPHLPPGLSALEAWEVGFGLPSLPSVVRWADYDVDVVADASSARRAVETFLAQHELPWEDTRGEKTRHYDLRPLVLELRVTNCGDATRLRMRLRCDQQGVGRPDQVVKALGLPEALRVHRAGLVLAEVSPAHDAWRRKGRYVG
jgi:radical SAM-linked protein